MSEGHRTRMRVYIHAWTRAPCALALDRPAARAGPSVARPVYRVHKLGLQLSDKRRCRYRGMRRNVQGLTSAVT